MREGRVDRHAASPGPAAHANEREDSIAQAEEPLGLDAEPLERVREFPHGLSDAFPAAKDGLPGAHVGRLDVLDVGSPEIQVNLPEWR
jgi:hypothetical protein